MAKVMSQESEQFILNSIEKVCELVEDSSLHPNDAVEKVARDLKLTPEYISLVCHGYNIGKQTHQRKTASTVLEKLAEFPLADPSVVIEKIYPTKVATPREEKLATAVSHEYSLPPRSKTSGYNPHGFTQNTSLKLALDHAFEDDPQKSFYKATAVAKQAAAEADAARMQKSRAYAKVADSLEALRSYVKYREPFSKIKSAVEKEFGKLGCEILEFVTPPKNPVPFARTVMLPLDTSELNVLVKSAIFAISDYNKAKASFEKTVKEAQETIDSVMEPYTFQPKIKSVVNRQKRSSIFSSTLLAANMLRDKSTPEDLSGKVEDTYKDLEFSPTSNQIRSLQARTQLEDYIRNDEIISGYSPHEVVEAYNEITSVAPRLATQPAMMRSLLRKRLAQGYLESFEANELANMERTLGETHGSSYGARLR